jgi:hypothetical protein
VRLARAIDLDGPPLGVPEPGGEGGRGAARRRERLCRGRRLRESEASASVPGSCSVARPQASFASAISAPSAPPIDRALGARTRP